MLKLTELKHLEELRVINKLYKIIIFLLAKDEKLDYEDENGNIVTAPWMLPPEDVMNNLINKNSTSSNNRSSNDPKEEVI